MREVFRTQNRFSWWHSGWNDVHILHAIFSRLRKIKNWKQNFFFPKYPSKVFEGRVKNFNLNVIFYDRSETKRSQKLTSHLIKKCDVVHFPLSKMNLIFLKLRLETSGRLRELSTYCVLNVTSKFLPFYWTACIQNTN